MTNSRTREETDLPQPRRAANEDLAAPPPSPRVRAATERAENAVRRFENSVEVLQDALRAVEVADLTTADALALHNRLESAAATVERITSALGAAATD